MKCISEEEHPFLDGYAETKYVWCVHCECVHPKSAWIYRQWRCPDEMCDGSIWDTWRWEDYLEKSGKQVSGDPEYGSYWPLY